MSSFPGDRPPSRGSQILRPHFRPVKHRVVSPHEQAVIDAGYPWARTNALIPTWMSPGEDRRPQPFPEDPMRRVNDRLNWHGHHGVNTHLIVEGDLTLLKPRKFFGQNHVGAVTLSTEPGAVKEAPVAPDEIYLGMTQQACKFVEGHRCLSPRSAHRYLSRGSIEWVDTTGRVVTNQGYICDMDKDGKTVNGKEYILEQLEKAKFETHFDFKLMRRVATCSFENVDQLTLSMRQWFLREWNDPESQMTKGDLRPVAHPLGTYLVPSRQDQERDVGGAGSDHSDNERGIDILIRAFIKWFQRGIPEN